jgi:hypothetical protein
MAGTATLNRSERKNPLDQLTADHDRKYVAIELLEPLVGHQYAAERLRSPTSTMTQGTMWS